MVHTIQDHTPKAARNQDTGRLSFIRPSMGGRGIRRTGGSAAARRAARAGGRRPWAGNGQRSPVRSCECLRLRPRRPPAARCATAFWRSPRPPRPPCCWAAPY
ncbi:DUF5136 domain-containing protein [Streptomyces bryophytorum]|nr:DUF5136 domain-containing protein [Actinacidiphila bryophytorum]